MHHRTRRRLTAAVTAAVAVTLAGCGVGSASHVVQGTAASDTTPTTAVSTPSTVAVSTPVTPSSTTTIPTSSSSTVNTQTLDQVAAQLGTVNDNLQQVNSDLNNPQGDS